MGRSRATGIHHAQFALIARALQQAKADNQKSQFGGRYYWSIVKRDAAGPATITAVLTEGKIRAVVEQVFALERIRDA